MAIEWSSIRNQLSSHIFTNHDLLEFVINVAHQDVGGMARSHRRVTPSSIQQYNANEMRLHKLQSVLIIPNEETIFNCDYFCLPRAIIMAKQWADGNQRTCYIKELTKYNCKLLKQQSEKLICKVFGSLEQYKQIVQQAKGSAYNEILVFERALQHK